MNKKNIVLIVAIILVIIALCILINMFKNYEKDENNSEVVEQSISETIKIKDNISKYENSKKSINVAIPEFQNLEDDYERFINFKIYNNLNDVSVYKDAIEGFEEDEIGFFTYETDYERYNCDKYISIVANQYIHLGDARPRIQKKCYVINAETNATAVLKDVFENKNNFEAAILEEINKQAGRKNIELVGGNGLKKLSDTQAFYIKNNKIIIYFEASEIAATAVGELEFKMPFKMVNGLFVI